MDLENLIVLILGICTIIGYSLVSYYYKQKYPEREFNYKLAFVVYLLGILYIIGAITDFIGVAVLLTLVIFLVFQLFDKKTYPEGYHKSQSSNIWFKIFAIYFIFMILVILGIAFL
ncbi:hypothetical protein [Methanobacterium sp. ACI-7]|uniref:hypothetical protein n=1 Tax=unclassified Methanobacterium TaxID=2627676 RepID=UPI0039C33EEF